MSDILKTYNSNYNLGLIHQLLKNKNQAGYYYCKAMEREPMNYEAHFNLAVLLNDLKDYEGAASEFKKAGMLLDSIGDNAKTHFIYDILSEVNQKIATDKDSDYFKKLKKLFEIFLVFFRIGAFTFGGGYAMIPLIQKETVENKKWITDDDILEIEAIAESTPGPIAINSSTVAECVILQRPPPVARSLRAGCESCSKTSVLPALENIAAAKPAAPAPTISVVPIVSFQKYRSRSPAQMRLQRSRTLGQNKGYVSSIAFNSF